MRSKGNNKKSSAKKTSTKENPLMELFVKELRDIYWAEKHSTKAFPKMARAAQSEELKDAFTTHLEETKGQIERLEQIFKELGMKPIGKKCHAMEGLVKEGEEVLEELEPGYVRDSALIISAQKAEHYEIASYGSLRTLAELMNMTEVVDLLQETLDEEGATDKKLTEIAVSSVNEDAKEETEEV